MSMSEQHTPNIFGREGVSETAKRKAAEQYYKRPFTTLSVAFAAGAAVISAVTIPASVGLGMGIGLFKDLYSPETVSNWQNWKAVERAERETMRLETEQNAAREEAKRIAQAAKKAAEAAAEEIKKEAQRNAVQGRITPELEADIFQRLDLRKIVCTPGTYTIEAKIAENKKITYFNENSSFLATSISECSKAIDLTQYPAYKKLGDITTKAHLDLVSDIFVQCAKGFTIKEDSILEDNLVIYNFEIAASSQQSTLSLYKNYQACVNTSHTLPQFQLKPPA